MRRIVYAATALLVSLLIIVPATAHASLFDNTKNSACGGAELSSSVTCSDPSVTGSTTKANSLIETALNLFSAIVGIIAVVMVIVGGIKYMTSGGEPAKAANAKDTLLYAGVGIVVVALSQFIVQFVFHRFK